MRTLTCDLVVAETNRVEGVTPERVLEKLTMAFRAQIVATLQACFLNGEIEIILIRNPFKDLMQLREMIDVFVEISELRIGNGLYLKLNGVSHFASRIDFPLTAITGVMDHQSVIRPWVDLVNVLGKQNPSRIFHHKKRDELSLILVTEATRSQGKLPRLFLTNS
ncbi:hypothetical protein [Novipirellula galeiformis]|uniref:hypothetical protein n=1 Tax=Novipirellula galeiformis TaxID=2528004 RepID=UPI0011B3633C|nr:hypothetical protein [Novipirellula galeiformis]